jgi:hypothetical protein
MAYDPTIPQDDDYIAQSAEDLRNNFGDDALNDLHSEKSDILDVAGEKTNLLSLAAAVSEVLDGSIDSHNLDASSPANGYYVRWECGLQVCFVDHTLDFSTSDGVKITLAQSFIDDNYVVFYSGVGALATGGSDWKLRATAYQNMGYTAYDEDRIEVRIRDNDVFSDTQEMMFAAVGRWK